MATRGSLRRSNDPTVLLLTSLASGPKHGYALLRDIEGFAAVTLGPGTLYGAISRLEKQGLIEALDGDDRRRPYQLTQAGGELLAEMITEMEAIARTGSDRLREWPQPVVGRA